MPLTAALTGSARRPVDEGTWRRRASILLVWIAIVLLGGLVAVQPRLALAAATAGGVAAVLLWVAHQRLAAVAVVAALAVVSVVDFPRQLSIGPATLYAWITVLVAVLIGLVSVSRYVLSAIRGLGTLFIPLYAFALWTLISMVWFRLSFPGIQNTLVYAAFAGLVPVTTAAILTRDLRLPVARRVVTLTMIVASILYLGSLAAGGLGGSTIIGARSYALLAVIGVAWSAAHVRYGDKRFALLAASCCLLVLLSLSRTAFAACMLVVVVAALDVRTPARFVRSALILGSLAAVAYFSVTSFGPLAARFQQGDVHSVGGGISINVSGRAFLWGVAWRDYLKSPIIGQGAGSVEKAIERQEPTQSQPHNDFLRVLHDLGIIGFALLVALFVAFFGHVFRAGRSTPRGDPAAPLHFAAGLATLGLLATMTTDNPIVYLFVVTPVAVIMGLSIGAFHLDEAPVESKALARSRSSRLLAGTSS